MLLIGRGASAICFNNQNYPTRCQHGISALVFQTPFAGKRCRRREKSGVFWP